MSVAVPFVKIAPASAGSVSESPSTPSPFPSTRSVSDWSARSRSSAVPPTPAFVTVRRSSRCVVV